MSKRIGGMGLWVLWGESRRGYRYVDVHIGAVLGYMSISMGIQGGEYI